MKARRAAALVATVWALGGTLGLGFVANATQPVTCQEDMPCWNPCTMGDHYGYTSDHRWVDCR